MKKNQHVVPHNGRWSVRGAGNTRVTQTFNTQREAIERAREIAINQRFYNIQPLLNQYSGNQYSKSLYPDSQKPRLPRRGNQG